ncbi:MAG: glycosyltransferase [Actinomycetota bacterium]|nr:glycosyltransferase [Actinomycetota bacterium]
MNTEVALPGIRELVRQLRPELIVSEGAEFAGPLVAESQGIPFVRLHPGAVHGWGWEGIAAPILAGIRQRLGLAADPSAHEWIDGPQVSFFPAGFDTPSSRRPQVCRVRPLPPAAAESRDDFVYITFGTEISGMPFFAAAVAAAVDAALAVGLRVLVSINNADPAVIPARDGVTVESWVAQGEVLPRARAVICHGGAGTVLGALTAGTPILAVPFFADQPFNAERIVQTGIGLRGVART